MKTKLFILALLMFAVSCSHRNEIDDPSGKDTGKEIEDVLSGKENGYTWVNLGLSVKWATMNVGATTPEGYGEYFAWGETAEKKDYSWSTYKHGTHEMLTKYCEGSFWGTVDNKSVLEPEDDAAHVNWGGTWRMPTDAEWTELREQCTWEWTTQNGINGYLVTSKKNSNSIFLPAAGYRNDTYLNYVGSNGYYWSSSLCEYGSPFAFSVYFDSHYVGRSNCDRYYGHSVRPVCP